MRMAREGAGMSNGAGLEERVVAAATALLRPGRKRRLTASLVAPFRHYPGVAYQSKRFDYRQNYTI